jgi:hypothetical protein
VWSSFYEKKICKHQDVHFQENEPVPTINLYKTCTFEISRMQHVEVPVPTAKKNEVLLKLQAATVNPVDWKIQKGDMRPLLPRRLPFIPGNCLHT